MTYTYQVPLTSKQANSDYNIFFETLISEATTLFDIPKAALYTPCRKEKVKYCRWMIWEIMRTVQGLSYQETGRLFGKYDHTTLMHAHEHLFNDFINKPYLKFIYERIVKIMGIDESKLKLLRETRKKATINFPSHRPISLSTYKAKLKKLEKLKFA